MFNVDVMKHEPRLTIAIKSSDEASDWAPAMTPLALRFARQCWPGPLAMVLQDNHPDGLVHQLPASIQPHVLCDDRIRLRAPGHRMLQDCMRLFAGPVVLAEPDGGTKPPKTVADLMKRCEQNEKSMLFIDDGMQSIQEPVSTIEIQNTGFRVIRGNTFSKEELQDVARLTVLFVCTGNTCRSPMAEALFRKQIAQKLSKISGFKGKVVWEKNMPEGQKSRSFSISKLKKVLKNRHKKFTSIEDGLRKTYEWFQANYKKNIRL